MAKKFFEMFENLVLEDELRALFEGTRIDRFTTDSYKKHLRVYLTSERLIPKKEIYKAQKELERQCFADTDMDVQIVESFHLSRHYDLEKLYQAYSDSILFELEENAKLDYRLIHSAEITCEGDEVLRLTLEDTLVARQREDQIRNYLEHVFCKRCGLNAKICIDYKEAVTDRFKEENEYRMEMLVRRITERVAKANGADAGSEIAEVKGNDPEIESILASDRAVPAQNPSPEKKRGGKAADNEAKKRHFKRSDAPDVLFGRDFIDEAIPIKDIIDDMGEVTIRGQIIAGEGRAISNNTKFIYSFAITDFEDSIAAKVFCDIEQQGELQEALKKGSFIKIKGLPKYDDFAKEVTVSSVVGIKQIKDFRVPRMDNSFKKRVELHCHTKMSDSDGVSYAKQLIQRAASWEMKALAITDHGVVQAFPEAYHTVEKMPDFKVLYGVEGYLVDDLNDAVYNEQGQSLQVPFVVFEIKTTGCSPAKHHILEISAVKIVDGEVKESFHTLVNPREPISFTVERKTGITDEMVSNAPFIEGALSEFFAFAKGAVLVSHNLATAHSFIKTNAEQININHDFTYVDSMALARVLVEGRARFGLDSLVKHYKMECGDLEKGEEAVRILSLIYIKFLRELEKQDIHTLAQINEMTASNPDTIRRLPSYHVIILARNEEGRRNLYRLVSASHVKYFQRVPRIPKSLLNELREGLIVGSACEAGELFQAILEDKPDDMIANIVQFYDYLEIQPIGNNRFMIREERFPDINTEEDLQALNRRIVELGEMYNKPVCATCDVHFCDPEDSVYRSIIMAGKGFADADEQAPLYFRTTEEMLEEFTYLGSQKAEEVVITNTNMIADMCEFVSPIHPDKCPPVIPNSDETLTNICYTKAHEIYGENLPEIVEERLKKELNSIITNGFAVMYIIAQKLVWKSNEDGYLVGSRGSVGSSFVATMAGITEVNPLSPHYYCSECFYSEFDSPDVKAYAGKAGCDMPDKMCPKCGAKLKKDGFDIPFETFLGFKGDKEPDIDLNFSGEYQSKAHKYTEVIFGAGQTFRAGTIGTLAEKTAYGYVKKYYEERNIHKRECEINRIVQGCVDVRRTTGQHPGGIIVLPIGYDINQFTPVQKPANDMTTDIITTHFDYHSIDHNLLKLDILGHDDPTMIRMLQDLTGIDPLQIPLDDPQVMSLFQNTEALGIKPEDIYGCQLGSLGIPEFGTDFAIQMLIDTNPQSFSDLVRIAGLAHGTDVWLGNAQKLISEGTATISTAICTRDDIMTYLIGMGVEASLSFTIMESVRKGKGLKPEWEEAMKAANVPQWYIWSCKKIKYMFPKAHAAAYVMMAWRIAYCKVNYTLAYYAAYFSIRATAFSYELMCQGEAALRRTMEDYKKRENTLSNKEQDAYKDMRIVQEMYARGFEFEPLDIFRASARNFQIVDGKIMPSLISVDGLAEKAAEGIVEAVKDGPFLSQDDFRERTKVTKTVTEKLAQLGLLGDIPESNQLSLFDMF